MARQSPPAGNDAARQVEQAGGEAPRRRIRPWGGGARRGRAEQAGGKAPRRAYPVRVPGGFMLRCAGAQVREIEREESAELCRRWETER